METWYKFDGFCWKNEPFIKEVQVEKSSSNSVWINKKAVRQQSQYDNYFRTFDEAKQYGVNKFTRKFEAAKNHLMSVEDRLKRVQNQQCHRPVTDSGDTGDEGLISISVA